MIRKNGSRARKSSMSRIVFISRRRTAEAPARLYARSTLACDRESAAWRCRAKRPSVARPTTDSLATGVGDRSRVCRGPSGHVESTFSSLLELDDLQGNRYVKRLAANPMPQHESSMVRRGVDGSSPSEGSAKFLLINSFCCPGWRRFWASTSTERPPRAAIASVSGLVPLLLSGFAGFPGGVHPASTARSIASASSSETACWRLHPASDRKSMPVAMLR
jgi:hypothetical protein